MTGEEVFGPDPRESQQLTYLKLGQRPRPVAFDRQRLKGLTARVGVLHHLPPYASKSAFTAFSMARAASSSHPRGRFFKSARKLAARPLPRWMLAVSQPMAFSNRSTSCSLGSAESSIREQSGASRRTIQRFCSRTNGSRHRTAQSRILWYKMSVPFPV